MGTGRYFKPIVGVLIAGLLFASNFEQNAYAQSLSITDAYVTDASGNVLTDTSMNILNKALCNQQIQIATTISNSGTTAQPIQIDYIIYKGSDGTISYATTLTGTSQAGNSAVYSTSWVPNSAGLYKVMILLYSNLGYNVNAVIGNDIDTITPGSPTADITTVVEVGCDTTQGTQSGSSAIHEVQEGVLSFQNPSVRDTLSGNPVNTITVGQLVQIGADVENSQSPEQSFAYAVQIVSIPNNIQVDYQWLTGYSSTGTSISPSLTWEPKSCGDFTANLFLYDNINDLNLLAAPLSLPLTVSGCTADSSTDVKTSKGGQAAKTNPSDAANARIAIGDPGASKVPANKILQTGKEIKIPARQKIPDWIKKNSEWFAQGVISEDDYVTGLEWMINNGVIRKSSFIFATAPPNEANLLKSDSFPTSFIWKRLFSLKLGSTGDAKSIDWSDGVLALNKTDEFCLELLPEEDEPVTEICLPPQKTEPIVQLVNKIEKQYYERIMQANIEMLSELHEREQNSTLRAITCPFDPEQCGTTGPTFPDPPLDDIFRKFEQAVEQADKDRNDAMAKDVKKLLIDAIDSEIDDDDEKRKGINGGVRIKIKTKGDD